MGSSSLKFFSNTAMHKHLQEVYTDPNYEGFGKPCDWRLRTGDGTEFQVHSAVLSAKSKFFRGLRVQSSSERISIYDDEKNCTVIHGMTPYVLEAILIYLCTGLIDLNRENMMHLLVAADFLMIDSLTKKCSRLFLLCFERAVKSSEDEAYDLPLHILMYFLGHKSVNVSEERFVWSFIEKWVLKDADNRLPMVPELLKCLYMDEIDEELALDIISSQIIQKHIQHKDLGDSLPASNKSRLVTLLGEDVQFIAGARHPPCLYFVTETVDLLQECSGDGVKVYMTYDESPDVGRKLGVLPFFPLKLFPVGHKVYIYYKVPEQCRGVDEDSEMFGGAIYNLLNGECTFIDYFPPFLDSVVDSSGRIYAVGEGDVLVYEENEWQDISPMQPMEKYIAAVSSNGLLYVIGEKDAGMFMQVYHPSSDEWKTASPPNIRRKFITVVEYRGRIFVVGGRYLPHHAPCREVEAFDPAREEWSLCQPLPFDYAPFWCTASKCWVMRGRLYIFCNGGSVYWDDSGEWKTAPSHQNDTFCPIEGEQVVREIMKKNRAAIDWQDTSLGNMFT